MWIQRPCVDCEGTGFVVIPCRECDGTGKLRDGYRIVNDPENGPGREIFVDCDHCQGDGVVEDDCPECFHGKIDVEVVEVEEIREAIGG